MEPAAEDYAKRVEDRNTAQKTLDLLQTQYDQTAAAADPDDPGQQQALEQAQQELNRHREALAAADEAVAAALKILSEAMMATTGLPPDEARAAVTEDRNRARALRQQANQLRAAASAG